MKTDEIRLPDLDAKTETQPELRRPSAFDENTQIDSDFAMGSTADFQRIFKSTRPVDVTPVTGDFLPPAADIRRRGFIAAVIVFATISVLCYFFAR